MLIASNRVADDSPIIKDLDDFSTNQVKYMEGNGEIKNNEAKNGHVETDCDENISDAKLSSLHVKSLEKLQKLLRMLGFSLAMFGMFHLDNLFGKKCTTEEPTDKKPRSIIFRVHSVYCAVVAALIFAFFVRSILAFFVGVDAKENFALRVVVATWSLQLLLNIAVILKASHPKWGYQRVACHIWNTQVLRFMESLEVSLNKKRVQKILKFILMVGWSIVVLNVCLIPILLLKNETELSSIFSNALMAPIPVTAYTKPIMIVVCVFLTVAWIVPVMYLMAVCFVVSAAFKVCKGALRAAIDKAKETNTYPVSLYRERMLHLNISRCLELMDKDFKYFYASMFFTNIPLACFILYQILKTSMEPLTLATFFFWLAANVLFVAMATLAGAAVNTSAHSPLDCIHDVGMEGICMEQLGQLHLFTSKLNGNAIGFTVMTFVPVTKEVFLTVGGLYITYFFILLQF